jgi:hypothetical protein
MKFALILTLFGVDGEPNYYYAVQTDISAIECNLQADSYETVAAELFTAGGFELTCEMDDSHED